MSHFKHLEDVVLLLKNNNCRAKKKLTIREEKSREESSWKIPTVNNLNWMSEEVLFFYWCSSCSYIFQLTWLVRFGWQLADFHCCYSELVILISWMNIVGGCCTTLCEHYFCCSTALYTRYIIWHSSVTQCWLCQNLLLLCSRLLYISKYMHIKTNFDFFLS